MFCWLIFDKLWHILVIFTGWFAVLTGVQCDCAMAAEQRFVGIGKKNSSKVNYFQRFQFLSWWHKTFFYKSCSCDIKLSFTNHLPVTQNSLSKIICSVFRWSPLLGASHRLGLVSQKKPLNFCWFKSLVQINSRIYTTGEPEEALKPLLPKNSSSAAKVLYKYKCKYKYSNSTSGAADST